MRSTASPDIPAAPPLSAAQHYQILRQQLEHEDNLVTQRLSWFLGSQAFLFSAFAIVLNAPMQSRFGDREPIIFFRLIPIMAIGVALLIWLAVLAGIMAMRRLRRRAVSRPEFDGFPPIQGDFHTRLMGQAAPVLLPPFFVVVWCILLIVG